MQKPASRIWILMARKLNNEISVAELQELGLLLRQHPDEHYAVEIVNEQWKQTAPRNLPELEKSFEKILESIQENENRKFQEQTAASLTARQPRTLWKKLFAISIAACIMASGFFLFRYLSANRSSNTLPIALNEISTRYGSKTKLLLPDSTQVWLNSGSKLTYDNNYGAENREVKLSGEAYFDVVKNSEKPFIIHTEKMDIRVLGTAFNVQCYPNGKTCETSLIRGSLEVVLKSRQSEKIVLKPNEKLVLADAPEFIPSAASSHSKKQEARQQSPDALVAIRRVSYDENSSNVIETSWVDNKLIFSGETFEDLAMQMERWFGVSIRFENRKLLQNRLTGTFENETVQQALEALQFTTKFKYNINKNVITIF